MSSESQINANRENAKKSTGPVTDAGKAASSQNHASHRLTDGVPFQVLSDENPDVFRFLWSQLICQFTPSGKAESAIVERMAEHEWMRQRALHFQEVVLEDAAHFRMKQMALFMRYEAQHERSYNACLNQLLKLRAEMRSEKIGFERKTERIQQIEWQKQRHETTQKSRQIDDDCKLIRAIRMAANNPEAKKVADDLLTRQQAA